MKTNKNSWDCSKKEFYDAVKNRKDELQEVIDKAKECPGYVDFDTWYMQEYNWRFLNDILGGQKARGVAPFDYCNLIHLPVMVWKDAQGKEHRVKFMGEKSPADYGFGITDLVEGYGIKIDKTQDPDGHLQFTVSNDTELGTGEAPTGAEAASYIKYGGKVYTFGSSGGTDVTKGWVTNNFQYKVYYGAEPSSPRDGDIWTTEGEEISDYNNLINKPKLNNKELKDNKTLFEVGGYDRWTEGVSDKTTSTYSAQEIDTKISQNAGAFRGTYTGGDTRPASFDFDAFLKSKITTTCYDGDYAYIKWTTDKVYDVCGYVTNASTGLGTWEYQLTISGEQISEYVKTWQINGNRLTLTNAQGISESYEPFSRATQKIIYSETEPTDAINGDLWVFGE